MECFKCKKNNDNIYINVAGSYYEETCRAIHKDLIPENAVEIIYCESCLKNDLGLNENIMVQTMDSTALGRFESVSSSSGSVLSSQQSAVSEELTMFTRPRPCPKRFKNQMPLARQPEGQQASPSRRGSQSNESSPSPQATTSRPAPQPITPRPGPKAFKRRMGWLPESAGSKKTRPSEQSSSEVSFQILSQTNSQPITQPSLPLRSRVESGSLIEQPSQIVRTQGSIDSQQVNVMDPGTRFTSDPPAVLQQQADLSSSGQSEPEVPIPIPNPVRISNPSPPRAPNPPTASEDSTSDDDDDDVVIVPVPNSGYIPNGAPHRPSELIFLSNC